jgi:hypothetical protein
MALGEAECCGYDVGMAQRVRFAVALFLLLLVVALLCGCKHRTRPKAIVVHLLRNLASPYGSDMDRRILEYQGSNPKLPSGQPIMVQSETDDYQEMLDKQNNTSTSVDVIVLDSADDVKSNSTLQAALSQATNVCAGLQACPTNIPAIIPAPITGAEREAARSFVDFLQRKP